MDQGEPPRKELSWHVTQCCADADLDSAYRLSAPGLFELQIKIGNFHAANATGAAVKSL